MSTFFCTICSRAKDLQPQPMPARSRYLGEHIGQVAALADRKKMPFVILSGLHGLLAQGNRIDFYEHRLEKTGVDALAHKVAAQLSTDINHSKVRDIFYCAKLTPNWDPYTRALSQAIGLAGASMTLVPFERLKEFAARIPE